MSEHIIAEALQQLRRKGIRLTEQRKAIVKYLILSHNHPTVVEIFKALEKDSTVGHVTIATIYNNLRVFIEAGLVQELTYGDQSSRFDFSDSDHYHIICEICGKVEDFHYPKLSQVEEAAEQLTHYQVSHHRMEVYGICPECQKRR